MPGENRRWDDRELVDWIILNNHDLDSLVTTMSIQENTHNLHRFSHNLLKVGFFPFF